MQYPQQSHSLLTFWAFRIHIPETYVAPKNFFSLDSDNKKESAVPQVILTALSAIPVAHHKSGTCLVPLPPVPHFLWQSSCQVSACTTCLQEDWWFSHVLFPGSPALHWYLMQGRSWETFKTEAWDSQNACCLASGPESTSPAALCGRGRNHGSVPPPTAAGIEGDRWKRWCYNDPACISATKVHPFGEGTITQPSASSKLCRLVFILCFTTNVLQVGKKGLLELFIKQT